MPSRPRQDFSDVDSQEALRRAEALIPFFREHAAEQEQATQMVPPVLEKLHESGLLRYMQPRRWGGMELEFVTMIDLPERIARGDASTAWTFTNIAGHHRMLSMWPEQTQEEIWGDDPDACIASGIAFPQGRGRKVDGGYVLTGQWGFSSGVDVSTWNMLACIVYDNDQPVDWCMTVIPKSDYEIVDDWQTLGMRGTGSRTVRCKDLFVPEHRVISMQVSRPGHSYPGHKLNSNPMYRIPMQAFAAYGIGGTLIGNAQAVVDLTIEHVKSRSTSYQNAKMRDFQTVQLRVGLAAARIDAARILLRHNCMEAHETVKAGRTFDMPTKLRYKRDSAVAIKLVTEAVDMLHEMAGANGIYDAYPIQRLFRDAHAGAGHFQFSTDAQVPPWGLVALGGEFKSPTI